MQATLNPANEVREFIADLGNRRSGLADCRITLKGGTLADVQVVAGGKYVRVFDLSGGLSERLKLSIAEWLESLQEQGSGARTRRAPARES